ncbi:hypothetical protein STSP2_01361 [Anaerohalosphaera lusitana]|uniref:Uncharacterized protein n=1 Tax=Anaerohalosphaera lusitana TaxID=1936003 RepID=A0A1U9NL20_9BACT|nr:hypothetical protein [Anaerohalosphaera lusitana]AQT68206.1 hypothetical protein STSP2_01361 [Anaerohalosphaera lusitana]
MNNQVLRIFIALVVLGGGAAVWYFGAEINAATLFPKEGTAGEPATVAEPVIVKQVTIGGVERDEEGKLRKTYGEAEEAPEACPT